MYYDDLSKYEYLDDEDQNVLNVGWIDNEHPFAKGEVPKKVLSILLRECVNNTVNMTRGFHQCPFCQSSKIGYPVRLGFRRSLLGSAEIRVKGKNGISYAAPNLIYHYVKDHSYLPPQVFIDAVLE